MPENNVMTATNYTMDHLTQFAKESKEVGFGFRRLAMIGTLSPADIAKQLGVNRSLLWRGVILCQTEGPDGLRDDDRSGRSSQRGEPEQAEIEQWVNDGPSGMAAWTLT